MFRQIQMEIPFNTVFITRLPQFIQYNFLKKKPFCAKCMSNVYTHSTGATGATVVAPKSSPQLRPL